MCSTSEERMCQQYALYAAEGRVPTERKVTDLQGYVDELRDLPYWERNFSQVRRIIAFVRPNDSRGSVGAWYAPTGLGQIEMAPCHLTELFVLHEVAHVLAAARYNSSSHDPWFARTYLELVFAVMGSAQYVSLRAAYDTAYIDYDTANATPGGRQV